MAEIERTSGGQWQVFPTMPRFGQFPRLLQFVREADAIKHARSQFPDCIIYKATLK